MTGADAVDGGGGGRFFGARQRQAAAWGGAGGRSSGRGPSGRRQQRQGEDGAAAEAVWAAREGQRRAGGQAEAAAVAAAGRVAGAAAVARRATRQLRHGGWSGGHGTVGLERQPRHGRGAAAAAQWVVGRQQLAETPPRPAPRGGWHRVGGVAPRQRDAAAASRRPEGGLGGEGCAAGAPAGGVLGRPRPGAINKQAGRARASAALAGAWGLVPRVQPCPNGRAVPPPPGCANPLCGPHTPSKVHRDIWR